MPDLIVTARVMGLMHRSRRNTRRIRKRRSGVAILVPIGLMPAIDAVVSLLLNRDDRKW
jgi:hypothetical protein